MAYSSTIVLRDLSTGAGRSGQVVTRRWADDNYAADRELATELIGKPGVYVFSDLPYKKSKLWVNDSEENSFGGPDGRWYPDLDLRTVFVDLGSDQTINGTKTFVQPAEYATDVTIDNNLQLIHKAFADVNYMSFADKGFLWTLLGNCLLVDNASPEYGKHYTTIQSAINYANSQSPAGNNKWTIFIIPRQLVSDAYSENLTLQPFISLIGIGLVKISGSIGGFNLNSRLQNLFFYRNNANVTIDGALAYGCVFRTGDESDLFPVQLILKNSELHDCKFYAVRNLPATKIKSEGNNLIFNPFSNIPIQDIQDDDVVIGGGSPDKPLLEFKY